LTVIEQHVDEFGFTSVNLARLYMSSGHVEVNPFSGNRGFYAGNANEMSMRPFPSLMIAILSSVTGLSPESILFLPVLALVSLLSFALMMRLLSGSGAFSALVGLILAFSLNFGAFNGVYYISYGMTFFSIFAFFFLKEYVSGSRGFYLKNFPVYLLLFITSLGSYYSSTFLILAMVFSLIILDRIKSRKVNFSIYPPLLFLVMMLVFEQMTYRFASMASLSVSVSGWMKYIQYLIGLLTRQGTFQTERPQFGGNPAILYSDLVNKISLAAILLLYLLLWLVGRIHRLSSANNIRNPASKYSFSHRNILFIVSLVVTGILEMILYSFVGLFAFMRVFYIAVCLFATYVSFVLYRSHRSSVIRYLTLGLLVLVLSSNVVHFEAYFTSSSTLNGRFDKVNPSINWLANYFDGSSAIYSYHSVAAPLFETLTKSKNSENATVYVIFADSHLASMSMIYVLLTNEQVIGEGYAQPLTFADIQQIVPISKMNIIYSDSYGTVYKGV
jgi:hypothetical protein